MKCAVDFCRSLLTLIMEKDKFQDLDSIFRDYQKTYAQVYMQCILSRSWLIKNVVVEIDSGFSFSNDCFRFFQRKLVALR